MHGDYSPSRGTKVTFSLIHFGILLWAGWLLLRNGATTVLELFSINSVGADTTRSVFLFAAGLIY